MHQISQKVAHVVTEHIEYAECYNDLGRRWTARLGSVHDSDDELHETAKQQSSNEEKATTTEACDDARVEDDGDDSDAGQDTGVLERIANASHLEEVGTIY